MDILMIALAFGTLSAFTIFGYLSARKTQQRLNEETPPSTLAADGPAARKNNEKIMPDV